MTLYTCRHDGDQYRITKLTNNLDVESSYLCTFDECECPAGVRPSCRHRQMLPMFVDRGAIDTGWMLDFDRGGWIDNRTEDELRLPLDEAIEEDAYLKGIMEHIPEGVQAVSLEDPAALHNAIAEAVGEPEAKPPVSQVPAPAKSFRRF